MEDAAESELQTTDQERPHANETDLARTLGGSGTQVEDA